MHSFVVMITGADSGVGYATALTRAQRGDEIVMVCRDQERGAAALQRIARVATGPRPTLLVADLSSHDAIDDLSALLHARFDHIDLLITTPEHPRSIDNASSATSSSSSRSTTTRRVA